MHRMKRITRQWVTRVTALSLGLLVLGAVAATPALAATSTSNMAVSALIVDVCTVVAGPLNFLTYSTTAATPTDATATLTATCTLLTPYTLTLGQGSHAAAGSTDTTPLRQMQNTLLSLDVLGYLLHQDAAHTTVWGNTQATGQGSTGAGLPQLFTVYGRIPAGQNKPPAVYTDVVVVTITF
jgi:spore coat protein U-like protein